MPQIYTWVFGASRGRTASWIFQNFNEIRTFFEYSKFRWKKDSKCGYWEKCCDILCATSQEILYKMARLSVRLIRLNQIFRPIHTQYKFFLPKEFDYKPNRSEILYGLPFLIMVIFQVSPIFDAFLMSTKSAVVYIFLPLILVIISPWKTLA